MVEAIVAEDYARQYSDYAEVTILFQGLEAMAPSEVLPKEALPVLRLLDEVLTNALGSEYNWSLLSHQARYGR